MSYRTKDAQASSKERNQNHRSQLDRIRWSEVKDFVGRRYSGKQGVRYAHCKPSTGSPDRRWALIKRVGQEVRGR